MNPLNQKLYNQLKQKFGDVHISNEGVAASLAFARNSKGVIIGVDSTRSSWGEYYQVCCPKCRDKRFRLWINHLWGTKPQELSLPIRHTAICYNEGCDWSTDLHDLLKGYFVGIKPIIAQGIPQNKTVVQDAGDLISLAKLSETHPAIVYLKSRNFCPKTLRYFWDVQFSPNTHRIHFPVKEKGEVVGWQQRYVDDFGGGIPPDKTIVKYKTAPGFKAKNHLYGFDFAKKLNGVIITEGVFDTIRLGPPAVCVFGNTLSDAQKTKIWNTWNKGFCVIALDPDASKQSKKIFDEFNGKFELGTHILQLPEKRDPASLTTSFLWNLFFSQIKLNYEHFVRNV